MKTLWTNHSKKLAFVLFVFLAMAFTLFIRSMYKSGDSIQSVVRNLSISGDTTVWLATPDGDGRSLSGAKAKELLKALRDVEEIKLSHPNFVDPAYEIRIHTKTESLLVNIFFKPDDSFAYVFVFLDNRLGSWTARGEQLADVIREEQ